MAKGESFVTVPIRIENIGQKSRGLYQMTEINKRFPELFIVFGTWGL